MKIKKGGNIINLTESDLNRISKPVDTTFVIPTFVQWRDK